MTMIFFRRLIYYFTTYEAILEIEFYESIELNLTHLSPTTQLNQLSQESIRNGHAATCFSRSRRLYLVLRTTQLK